MKSIPLPTWAERHYSPAPSLWVLRKWAREGQIFPPPERVGRDWYVREDAKRQTAGTVECAPLVDQIKEMDAAAKPVRDLSIYDHAPHIYSLEEARVGCREFYDPRDVGCGVYLVLNKEKTTCLYVGSSVQLNNRLRNGWHAPPDQPTFSFEVPEEIVRDVETTYWVALQPRVNQKSPPGQSNPAAVEKIRSLWKC